MAMATIQSSNPIEAATRRHTLLFTVYIAVLVFTALLIAVMTWLVEKSGNNVQDAIQADADARIALAGKDAAQANKTAKQLDSDLTTEKGKVAGLQKDAADAKAAQQRVEIELSQQQEKTANAERELLHLRQAVQPRSLSEQQRKTLTDALLNIPKIPIAINCILGDREGCLFAEQIKQVFVSSGWDVGPGVGQGMYSGDPTGLELHILKANPNALPNLNDVPPSANALQEAFFSIGLALRGGFVDRIIPPRSIEIFVGGKPKEYR